MQPITYFCNTPTTRMICERYGDCWEKMELADRLCIASGVAECIFSTEGIGQDADLVSACTSLGYEFGTEDESTGGDLNSVFEDSEEHTWIVDALDQLDKELNIHRAARLVQGLLQHELLVDQNNLLIPQAQ